MSADDVFSYEILYIFSMNLDVGIVFNPLDKIICHDKNVSLLRDLGNGPTISITYRMIGYGAVAVVRGSVRERIKGLWH